MFSAVATLDVSRTLLPALSFLAQALAVAALARLHQGGDRGVVAGAEG